MSGTEQKTRRTVHWWAAWAGIVGVMIGAAQLWVALDGDADRVPDDVAAGSDSISRLLPSGSGDGAEREQPPDATDSSATAGSVRSPAPTPTDPVDARVAELEVLFGEADEGTAIRQWSRVLEGYDRPVSVRLTSYSSGSLFHVDPEGAQRSRLQHRMDRPGAVATERITIATACGDAIYDLEATLLNDAEARVLIRMDGDATRLSVDRAIRLDRCTR